MSAESPQYENALNGDYWELVVVIDTGELDANGDPIYERTAIAGTLAGVNTSQDTEDWSIEPSTGEITVQNWGRRSYSMEWTNAFIPQDQALVDLGVLDEEGYPVFHNSFDLVEVWYYDRGPDAPNFDALDPMEIQECPAFDPRLTEDDMQSGDAGERNFEAYINGRPRFPMVSDAYEVPAR